MAKMPSEIFLAVPGHKVEPGLLETLSTFQVKPVFDFHAPEKNEIRAFLGNLNSRVCLRIFQGSKEIYEELDLSRIDRVFLEARACSTEMSGKFFEKGIKVGLIVTGREDLEIAIKNNDLPVMGRGNETGGYGGPLGTLVLFQLLKKELGRPFFIDGPFDIPGAVAMLASGASGVVIGGAAWGFPDFGTIAETFRELRGIDAVRIESISGAGYRGIPRRKKTGNRKTDLTEIRRVLCGLSLNEWRKNLGEDFVLAGQDIEFLRKNLELYKNLSGFLSGLRGRISAFGNSVPPEKENRVSGELGTAFPIVQGPMARISDKVAFLKEISLAGAFPVAAFASAPPEICRKFAQEYQKEGISPGYGIIGLGLQPEILKGQIEVLKEYHPKFVWVAAPQPDLVRKLIAEGITVVSHAPSATFLSGIFETGCRWFILEGSESGGHIGKFSSLMLWQIGLAEVSRKGWESEVKILFAGGLASRDGIEFVSNLVGSYFPERKLAWGIQLGTSFLGTREAVESGGISRNYRNCILNSDNTIVTGETVGLRARQAATPFVEKILQNEEDRLAAGLSLQERRLAFEHDNVGNLARAVKSKEGEDGCFMAGEGLGIMDRILSMRDLCEEFYPAGQISYQEIENISTATDGVVSAFCHDGKLLADPFSGDIHEPIAVIGIGCVFPGSPNAAKFFENIVSRKCFIKEMPPERLDPEIFFNSNPANPLTSYSRVAALVEEFSFDPVFFKIPPRISEKMEIGQKWALECTRQIFEQTGYLKRDFPREDFSVFIGNSMGGIASVENLRAVHFHEFATRLKKTSSDPSDRSVLEKALHALKEKAGLTTITEDSLPGELASIIAGRVCSVFDLHGTNYTVDAACGSGLAAVTSGVNALRLRQASLVLAGGVDSQMDPASFIKFSKVTALSAKGSFPFDYRADGFVMGEGAALVLLKRYSDAIRDGDKIFALVLGVGQSSDGRGKGITAPNPEGQLRALTRAWKDSGCDPAEVGYIEAHGTGTKVGDEIELRTISNFLSNRDKNLSKVPVGSVKGMIGHTKAAAGIAGLLKAIMTVHQRVIPAQVNFERFPENSPAKDYPVTIPVKTQPFTGKRFLAGVSSFGFGGTNHHVVISEPPVNRYELVVPRQTDAEPELKTQSQGMIGKEKGLPSWDGGVPGARGGHPPQPANRADGVAFAGLTALVFPGQGSQYIGMLSTWRNEERFKQVLEKAERIFSGINHQSILKLIYPEAPVDDPASKEKFELLLQNTLVAQPAIFTVSVGLLEIARERGLSFDLALGHSLGEYTALYSAGVISLEDALNAVCIRGRYMSTISGSDLGCMGIVALPAEKVAEGIREIQGYVVCSNLNSPTQTVISGETPAVEEAIKRFAAKGVTARRLNVSAAFHSRVVAGAVPMFRQTLEKMDLKASDVRVPANISGAWYPIKSDSHDIAKAQDLIIDILSRQVTQPVDFIDQIERAYSEGVRTFVEVGPKNILSRLISENLGDRPHKCLFLDHHRQDGRKLLDKALHYLKGEEASPEISGESGEGFPKHSPGAPPGEGSSESLQSGRKPEPCGPTASSSVPKGSLPTPESPSGIESVVQKIIQDISGYPSHMIQPETDLEADLGIDTLKLFEVASRVKDTWKALGKTKFELTRLKNLKSICGFVQESLDSSGPVSPEPGKGGENQKGGHLHPHDAAKSGIHRYLFTVGQAGVSDEIYPIQAPTKTGLAIIKTSGFPEFDSALKKFLEESGWKAETWTPAESDFEALESGSCPDTLAKAELYIHSLPVSSFARKKRKRFYRDQILSLFMIAGKLGKQLSGLLVLTDAGGNLSSPTLGMEFLSGVFQGFCLSVEKDFPGIKARNIDLPSFSPGFIGKGLGMAFRPDNLAVIGLSPEKGVSGFQLSHLPLEANMNRVITDLRRMLNSQITVLATGGGGGITRRLITLLAMEFRPRIIILGRTVEKLEVVQELRKHGVDVVYFQCDLSDGPAVDRTVGVIKKSFPRIDLLLHGAGIEISRNLANKTPAEIDMVYRVKVAGIVNLLDAFGEENIGLVMNFSSVSSLFGNPGQVDYAAANGFLNRFRGQGVTRFLTIAWSAWEEIGMASRGAVFEILKSSGVEFIQPEVGERIFLRELHHNLAVDPVQNRTVAYFGKLGDAIGNQESLLIGRDATPHQENEGAQMHGLGEISIDPVAKPHLLDHSIGGKCLFPAVESIGSLVNAVFGEKTPERIRLSKIRFHHPVKIPRGEKIRMEFFQKGSHFELWMSNPVNGEKSGKKHLSCHIETGEISSGEKGKGINLLQKVKLVLRREKLYERFSAASIDRAGIYRILFHGPKFQVLKSVDGFNRHGLLATVCSDPDVVNENPMTVEGSFKLLLEAALHGAGLVCLLRVMSRKFFLPFSLESLEISSETVKKATSAKVWVEEVGWRIDSAGPSPMHFMKFNVVVTDQSENVLIYLGGLEMVAGRDEPQEKETFITLGTPYLIGPHPFMAIDVSDVEKISDGDEILKVLLLPQELEKLAKFQLPKRRNEWLAGRLALKILVRDLVRRKLGLELNSPGFQIISEGEQPHMVPVDGLEPRIAMLVRNLKTSITHGGGVAVASVGNHNIGVDVEAWKVLEDRMVSKFLVDDERKLVPSNEYIALWTAKEAVCKAHGSGFGIGDLLKIHISEFGYNEPYYISIPELNLKYSCMTFKDTRWVISIAVAN